MTDPDVGMCPRCKTHKSFLEPKIKVIENDTGQQEYAGSYKSCECGALTRDQYGTFNLRGDVAEEYGAQKRNVFVRVQPKLRRKG